MTERDLGNTVSWWIGEVVNVYDPDQSGRVQVRVYGRHDDKTNIPDAALPWALPLQPVTSAAYGKLGTAPVGLVRGSKVMGFWMDSDQQYPVIWGSFGKAGDPVPGKTQDGTEKIDIATGSIPSPTINQSDPMPMNPYAFGSLHPDRIDINKINDPKGQDFKKINQFTPSIGVTTTTKVDEKLKEPKKPTTASLKKTEKGDILDQVSKVDPDKLSRSLPNMVDGYKTVRDVFSVTSPNGLTNMLSGGLQNAMKGLTGALGVGGTLGLMSAVLKGGSLGTIAQNALRGAMAGMAVEAALNGGVPEAVPSLIVPVVDALIGHPERRYILTTVPQTHITQYYGNIEEEPYPGYIVYLDPLTGQKYYKLRGPQDYYYPSATDYIQYSTSREMQNQFTRIIAAHSISDSLGGGLGGNIIGGVVAAKLPAPALAAMSLAINSGLAGVAAKGIASVLGNGISLDNITKFASNLIPNIAGNIKGMLDGQLPKSVLDAGEVSKAMSGFTKDQALLAVKKKAMKKALDKDPKEDDAAMKKYADFEAQKAAALGKVGTVSVPLSDGSSYEVQLEKSLDT